MHIFTTERRNLLMREKNLFDRTYFKTHPKQNKVEVLSDIDKKSKTSKNMISLPCVQVISVFFEGGMLQVGATGYLNFTKIFREVGS